MKIVLLDSAQSYDPVLLKCWIGGAYYMDKEDAEIPDWRRKTGADT